MMYCPKCNSVMRFYLKYINGIAKENWHCGQCGYDTMTIKTLLTDRTNGRSNYGIDQNYKTK